ncbi:MAG TPA: hypothetical protein VFS21_21580 [Roseiflexaceae bacterium]|nr:hypothetical protein [Roseiflexaceae bacterium]
MKRFWIVLLCCAALFGGWLPVPPARAADAAPVNVAAMLGGSVTAAAVAGETAFIGEGASLLALDLSDPAAPRPLGRAPLKDSVRSIDVAGNYVYLVIDEELWTLDVRDPARPAHLGTIAHSFPPRRVYVDGGLLYLIPYSEMGSLLVYDLADPARPALRSTLNGRIEDAVVGGRTLYMIDSRQGGLVIVDFSDPGAPQTRSRYVPSVIPASGASYTGLALSGTRLVMTLELGQERTPHLLTLDVANPAAPVPLAGVTFDTGGLALAGSLLVTMEAGHLRLVDMGDPARPAVLGSYAASGWWGRIAGGRLYTLGVDGLLILDISNPAAPVRLGSYAGIPGMVSVDGFLRVGQSLYTTSIRGAQILGVSQPLTPTVQGTLPFEALQWLRVDGDRLYGLDYGPNGLMLRIFDASDPFNPIQRLTMSPVDDARLLGDLAYLITKGELRIYNISDLSNPTLLGQLSISPVSSLDTVRLWLVGANAYVGRFYDVGCGRGCTKGRVALTVVDISTPASPRARAQIDFDARPYRQDPVAVVGPAIYLAGSSSLVDVSDPDAPVARPAGPLGGADAVQLDGTRAYAINWGVLRTVDLSDPLNPKQISELRVGGYELAVVSGIAYVAAIDSLRVVDVSDPAHLRPRATQAAPVENLALVDGLVYLALGSGGLRIVRVNPDAFPRPVYLPLVARF